MKKLFFILLCVCAGMVACKKSGSTKAVSSVKPPSADSNISISATIDGNNWQTDTVYANIITNPNDTFVFPDPRGFYNLEIVATNNNGSTINMYIYGYTGVGVYNINPPNVSATYYNGTQRHYATAGQINVQRDSTSVITGTFNFTVPDSTSVTNGVFYIQL